MDCIKECINTPIVSEYDLIVCGGGVAGISAAVSAKRNGVKRVLLIEKSIMFGGLATIGLISWFEPVCDGKGNKLINGMASELLELSRTFGPDTYPDEWKKETKKATGNKRFSGYYSPTVFSMALDEFVVNAGVDVLFDSLAVNTVVKDGVCDGVIVENKTGRTYYRSKVVIDTTGDLDIMFRSGCTSELGKNYLTFVGYQNSIEDFEKVKNENNIIFSRRWITSGSNLWGKGHPDDFPKLSGTTAQEVTKFVLAGRKMFFENCKEKDRKLNDVSVLPSMAQFRTTRRLVGDYTLTEDDKGKFFSDSIGCVCDFSKPGELYEIPYRTLYQSEFSNLLTAGRTISSAGWAWEVTRVIPVAILTGQAAGIAASLAIKNKSAVKNVSVDELQTVLKNNNIILHCDER